MSLRVDPPRRTLKERLRKIFGPIITGIVLVFTKLKLILLPLLKFLPVLLKTGGTMILTIGVYAFSMGWRFALGFVALIFVHECGHLIVAKKFGLKVGAPMFIPFMGAFIALKDAPRDAWMEACVGIGGPLLGTLAAAACFGLYGLAGNPLFMALAYSGFLLNLFNLVPIGFLDGGRIATALSPWLWVIGVVIMGAVAWLHPNLIVILVLVASLPRLLSLFRARTDAERRYFEIAPRLRATMAVFYFGLIAVLVYGMHASSDILHHHIQG